MSKKITIGFIVFLIIILVFNLLDNKFIQNPQISMVTNITIGFII